MSKKGVIVDLKVRDQIAGHRVKDDQFSGSPEAVVEYLLQKYVGRNGWERLGALFLYDLNILEERMKKKND